MHGLGLTIAAAQPMCRAYDVARNAVSHAEVIHAAAARVVVFPELSLTGYVLDAAPVHPDDDRLRPVIDACAGVGGLTDASRAHGTHRSRLRRGDPLLCRTALGFELVEDSPSVTNDGRPKRWVVVRPPDAATGLLLAQADDDGQQSVIGAQFAGRVGLFLRVDDFDAARQRMLDHGVEFVTEPRDEDYGRVVVFVDVAGNRWDLLGPRR